MRFGPEWIMALSGLLVGVGGLVLSRRGQKDEERDQKAANALADRVQSFQEVKDIADLLKQQLAAANAALREQEVTYERRHNEQAQRCRSALGEAMSTLHTLQAVVRAEISKEAAQDAIDEAQRHTQIDHPTDQKAPEDH